MRQTAAAPPTASRPTPAPCAWSDLFAAFLEEKNIRWGELVGGLLIVGCSIALVISFWARIAERPFLKFFVFNGVTAALFGLGLYSEHRWRLRTTSRGLLLIAALLTPLNFLAIAAFNRPATSDYLLLGGELASTAIFVGLLHGAGRILVPGSPWLVVIGVLAPSVMQLLTRRFVHHDTPLIAEWLGLGTVAVMGAVNGAMTWRKPALPTEGAEQSPSTEARRCRRH